MELPWPELLGSFGNVKTLFMDDGLVGQLSRSLKPGEGEPPTELLPEPQELPYYATDALHDAFAHFIDTRQKAGRSVTVIHLSADDETAVRGEVFFYRLDYSSLH